MESFQGTVDNLPDTLEESDTQFERSFSTLNAGAPAFVPRCGLLGPAAPLPQVTLLPPQLPPPPLMQAPLLAQPPSMFPMLRPPMLPFPHHLPLGMLPGPPLGVPPGGGPRFGQGGIPMGPGLSHPSMMPPPPPQRKQGPPQQHLQISGIKPSLLQQQQQPKQPHHLALPAPAKHKPGAAATPPVPDVDGAELREIKSRLAAQVEFYFSDQNLPGDAHLLKLVKKDAEGFVPLGHVAAFRKVKALMPKGYPAAACNQLLASALQDSSQLVVSDDGKKVARKDPLPDFDVSPEAQARTVVADNLPPGASAEAMEELFSRVGKVKAVRIRPPSSHNGASQARTHYPKVHAIVEYESADAANLAVKELNDERNWRTGLRVQSLARYCKERAKREYNQSSQSSNTRKQPAGGEDGGAESDGRGNSKGSAGEGEAAAWPAPAAASDADEAAGGGSASDAEGSVRRARGARGRGRGRGRGGSTSGLGLTVGTPPKGTPPKGSLGSSPVSSYMEMMKPPPGPRMPDGTRGFSMGRGKSLPPAAGQPGAEPGSEVTSVAS